MASSLRISSRFRSAPASEPSTICRSIITSCSPYAIHAVAGKAVASGAAGLLVVRLQALRQVEVGDEADVRLVDAHPESNRGDHHHALAADEAVLVGLPLPRVHAGVIGQRLHAAPAEPCSGLVHAAARQAVDDAGVAAMLRVEESGELLAGAGLQRDAVLDVRPVEAADEPAGAGQAEPCGDFPPRRLVGGSGQRHPRHARKALLQYGELEVFRPEVVSPLRDAVRLVDGEEREVDGVEQRQRPFAEQPFGRGVQQVDAARAKPRLDVERLALRQRRIEIRGAHARLEQRRDWSRISAMSGDTTTAVPPRTSAGIW